MKIYIGNGSIDNAEYKNLTEVEMLKYIADDSECTSIILDGILKTLGISEIPAVLDLVNKKLRNQGELVIADIDFDLLVFAHKKLNNLKELNQMVESVGGFKSFITYNFISEIMKNYRNISLTSADINNLEFKLTFKKSL
jgi:hypothetical protein